MLVIPAYGASPIFTVSDAAYNQCSTSCSQYVYDSEQVANGNHDVFNVTYDHFGDSLGQILTANPGYPILDITYTKRFVYSPTSLTDLHLYTDYWVNAYVYSPGGGSSSAWLFAQYRVYFTKADGTQSDALPAARFEFDQTVVKCGILGCGPAQINSVNSEKTFDADIGGNCAPNPQFCNFVIGLTYTFELVFEITANPSSYIQNTHGQLPAYLYTGFAGTNDDFSNKSFCLILSYQSSPVGGCPQGTGVTGVLAQPFTVTGGSNINVCPGSGLGSTATYQGTNGFFGSVALSTWVIPSTVANTAPETYVWSYISVPVPPTLSLPQGGSGTAGIQVGTQDSTFSTGTFAILAIGSTNGTLQYRSNTGKFLANVDYGHCSGSGGGGGSVAASTLITLEDGTTIPVQNIQPGMRVLIYDVPSKYQSEGTVIRLLKIVVNSTLTLDTSVGLTFRADANPHVRLWVFSPNGPVRKEITMIQEGDQIYNYDLTRWVAVTKVTVHYGGHHMMYDLVTRQTAPGEYIANGYPDCSYWCKSGPTP